MRSSQNASQQANNWAQKKKEQMEKAAQLRAERKQQLANTGEMALGVKTNYDFEKPPSQNSKKQDFQSDYGNNVFRQPQYAQSQFQYSEESYPVQPQRQSSLGKQQPIPPQQKYNYNQTQVTNGNKPSSQEGFRKQQPQQQQYQPQQNNKNLPSKQSYGQLNDDYDSKYSKYGQVQKQEPMVQQQRQQPPSYQKPVQNRPPSGRQDDYSKPQQRNTQVRGGPPSKNTQQSTQQQKQTQQYYNPIDDIPIKKGENQLNLNANPEPLYECSKGCGRTFAQKALQKHEKICVKVFQKQRKQFDAQKHRIISNDQVSYIKNIDKIEQKYEKALQKKQNWKQQSEAFRAAIIAAKGGQLTKAQQNAMQQASKSNLVQCNYCGRSFNDQAAQRHIPFCAQKSKIPPKQPQKRR